MSSRLPLGILNQQKMGVLLFGGDQHALQMLSSRCLTGPMSTMKQARRGTILSLLVSFERGGVERG